MYNFISVSLKVLNIVWLYLTKIPPRSTVLSSQVRTNIAEEHIHTLGCVFLIYIIMMMNFLF